MRSIRYCGRDFSELCSAEVVGRTVNALAAEAMEVPGRAGALPVSSRVVPAEVTVRLFLDMGFRADVNALAEARHKLSFWLCVPGGGELVLPDEPERIYHDAMLVDVGEWSKLFSDGQCDVTFMLFDPVAYGMERVERGATFEVGGTWATWPVFELVASAGSAVQVGCGGAFVRVEHAFAGGEAVRVECEGELVTIDGVDARADVSLASDFFALEPGDVELVFSGCTSHVVIFNERWL